MQLRGEGSVSWEQFQELCIAMGVAEETAQDAWQRAGGGDGGTVDWEHILSHLAALSTHVCPIQFSEIFHCSKHVTQKYCIINAILLFPA